MYTSSDSSNFIYNDNNNMFNTAGGFDYSALYVGDFGKKYLKAINYQNCRPTLNYYTTIGNTVNSNLINHIVFNSYLLIFS